MSSNEDRGAAKDEAAIAAELDGLAGELQEKVSALRVTMDGMQSDVQRMEKELEHLWDVRSKLAPEQPVASEAVPVAPKRGRGPRRS